MTSEQKLSPVEGIKEASRHLRGTIGLELLEEADHFNDDNKQLLKFHGTYQQDDRDARKRRGKTGVGKYYMFMVRCKIPGGKVTAAQYLGMDDLAEKFGNGTMRLTSRQGIQLHGVLKTNLKETIAGINETLLSTLGACGDVERNVMAPPAPFASPVYEQLQKEAAAIADHLAPRSRAYYDIWLNGKQLETPSPLTPLPPGERGRGEGAADEEPIYGKVYLPRKFKTGLATTHDNLVDVYAQDLGFLALLQNDKIVGYNVLVGGGLGMTHGNENTFPYLGKAICWIEPDQVVQTAEAVVKLFRDHGNRSDRKRARIKYVVHDWGVDKFRDVLAGYLPFPLVLPRPFDVEKFPLHLGWHAQGDGKFFYGISVENGRIKDEGEFRLRTALRTLVERLQPEIRLTPIQDILLCNLPASAKEDIERTLAEHGVRRPGELSEARKHSMACPAIPTCGLAISESERALPDIIDQLEVELQRVGLADEKISVRMTGCPNGCARPYQSDIGIVGRSGEKFTVFVGGNLLGTRLNFILKDLVPKNDIVPLLAPILQDFKNQRLPNECFGDYCHRIGCEKLLQRAPQVQPA